MMSLLCINSDYWQIFSHLQAIISTQLISIAIYSNTQL